jgi:hypothetical protein
MWHSCHLGIQQIAWQLMHDQTRDFHKLLVRRDYISPEADVSSWRMIFDSRILVTRILNLIRKTGKQNGGRTNVANSRP